MSTNQSTRVGGAGLLALVATYGIGRLAYGLFVPRFEDDFGLSVEVLGYYASAAQAGYLLAIVLTGLATARFGPRIPVVVGCLVLSVGAALTATATGPVLLAIGITLAGTSAGGAWAPFSDAVEAQVRSPGDRRALALVNAGSPVGLVVASALLLVLGDGWRVVWWAFAVVGLVAAYANWRVLTPVVAASGDRARPQLSWFVTSRSVRLFAVAIGLSVTSGAYFAYAPEIAQGGDESSWIGPGMWAVLGAAGAAVGAFGASIVDRLGLRWPMFGALLLVAVTTLGLVAAEGSRAAALTSAGLFGVGFTVAFALLVIWSQQVYWDRPTTGFTAALVCIAVGFTVGPSLFGVLDAAAGRPAALLASALPAVLVAWVPPAPAERAAFARAR